MKIVIVLILLTISVSCKDQTKNPGVSEEKSVKKSSVEKDIPEQLDIIEVRNPVADQVIKSPLEVKGKARGYWFFEGDAPVEILDRDRNKIAESYIQAQGEWMTKDFVPFTGSIEFKAPKDEGGYIVFKRANPPDLRENDREYRIPIIFSSK